MSSNIAPSTVVALETGPVVCQRCRRPFVHLAIDEIAGIRQLRAGNVLIAKLEAVCPFCGCVFRWSLKERELAEINKTYQELLKQISTYKPE